MTIGSKVEKLTDVFPELLAQIKDGKKGQMQLFAATESRGIEDDVLAAADSNVVEMYFAFQKALEDKQFLFAEKGRAENDYADFYYKKLSAELSLEKLHSSMRRNYAAALQDDAQQVMNGWMKTSLDKTMEAGEKKDRLPKKVFKEKVRSFPFLLERATELLGSDHYMYATLQARKHFFEGYLLANSDKNPNKELGDQALAQFRQALTWQPEMPQAYWQMSNVFGWNLLLPDSAEVYAQKALQMHPNWITPHLEMAMLFGERFKQYDRVKNYLVEAMQIDSSSFYVWNSWGNYYKNNRNFSEAERHYKKANEIDPTHGWPYNNLGIIYARTRRFDEAEQQFKKAIQIDSTNFFPRGNLALMYTSTRRMEEAEEQFKKAIQLDSTQANITNNLGDLYLKTQRWEEAEKQLKKALELDSIFTSPYNNLGIVCQNTRRYDEAEKYFKKVIQLDSTFWEAYANLGLLYQNLQRWEASEVMLQKSIESGPPLGLLYAILGNAYTHLPNRLEDAKLELDKAIEMDADWPGTYIYLAQWSLKKNKIEEAWQYLEQGLEKDIDNGEIKLEGLKEIPDFEEMRKEARWGELMGKYFPEGNN